MAGDYRTTELTGETESFCPCRVGASCILLAPALCARARSLRFLLSPQSQRAALRGPHFGTFWAGCFPAGRVRCPNDAQIVLSGANDPAPFRRVQHQNSINVSLPRPAVVPAWGASSLIMCLNFWAAEWLNCFRQGCFCTVHSSNPAVIPASLAVSLLT